MRSRIKIIALLLALLAAGFFGWYFLWYGRSTEAQIKNGLADLCADASKRDNEGGVTGPLKLAAMERYFAPNFFVAVDHRTFDGEMTPKEVAGALSTLRRHTRYIHFSVEGIKVFPGEKEDEARAVFTAEVTGVTKSGEKIDEVRELACLFRRNPENRRWQIARLEIQRVLEK